MNRTRPPQITVCGSSKHPNLISDACRHLLLTGWSVNAPVPFGREPTTQEAQVLADDHNRKIADSDAVYLVPKPDGTFGESVTQEGQLASSFGIAVYDADNPAPDLRR